MLNLLIIFSDMSQFKKENSYTNIIKRISSFGGIQVFNILINLIRGKFVALLLGPEGMGISSLFTSSTNTIQQLSGLGLNLAIVKEVAAHKDNEGRLSQILAIALRLILFTSILGAVACVILSPLLSKWSFGSYDYTLSFIFLSAGVALTVGGTGYLALLQGLGEVKRLSKASIVGGLTGLFGGVPMYYFWGDKGIVPAIVLLALTTFIFYFFSLKKTFSIEKASFSYTQHKPLIRRLIALGLILMTGSVAGTLSSYLINIFIRNFGSVDNVGLFQAANSITNQYVGIVFSALALDYFPRLSSISSDLKKMNQVVNRQAEIVIVIMTPLIICLFLTTPWIIKILLAETFLPVSPLVKWLGMGVLLQGITFPLGYLYIANENRKLYFWLEIVVSNLLWITCSFVFYYFFSLVGLGISLVARTSLDIIITYLVCRKYYGFRYSSKTVIITFVCLLMGIGSFFLSLLPESIYLVWLPVILILSLIYSGYILFAGIRESRD